MTKISDEMLADAEWLEQVARYFEKRDTSGEDMAFWANVMNAERCRSIAQSLRAQGGVRVKPLEWEESIPGRLHADPYMLERVHLDDWGLYVWSRGEKRSIAGHLKLGEARAAAQADYERRILSAIEASPAPVSEEMVERALNYWCSKLPKAQREQLIPEKLRDHMRETLTAALAAKGGQ